MISGQINDMVYSDENHMPSKSSFASTEFLDIMGKTKIFAAKKLKKRPFARPILGGGVN